MIDIRLIRKDPDTIEKRLKTKDPEISLSPLLSLDQQMREIKPKLEHLKAERNKYSSEIGELKRKGQDVTALLEKVATFIDEIDRLDALAKKLEEEFCLALMFCPLVIMMLIMVRPRKLEKF